MLLQHHHEKIFESLSIYNRSHNTNGKFLLIVSLPKANKIVKQLPFVDIIIKDFLKSKYYFRHGKTRTLANLIAGVRVN